MTGDTTSKNKRRLLIGSLATGGVVIAGAATKVLVDGMQPTQAMRDARLRSVDVSDLDPGKSVQIEFLNRPVLIYRRTSEQLRDLEQPNEFLLDPGSIEKQQPEAAKNSFRSIKTEFLVVHPECTHLGCGLNHFPHGTESPNSENVFFLRTTDWKGGFSCPCHGAMFDMAGRVYKNGPALKNLLVPAHRYTGKTEIEFIVPEPAT